MHFRITGLSPTPFRPLFGLSDAALAARTIRRITVDQDSAFPCRIEMRHATPGETVLLLNHVCQPAETPYKATHAIFIREGAEDTYDQINQIPEVMRPRLLSLRAYDATGMMIDADITEGTAVEPLIERLLANPNTATIHAHNAKRGCYAGRIDRA